MSLCLLKDTGKVALLGSAKPLLNFLDVLRISVLSFLFSFLSFSKNYTCAGKSGTPELSFLRYLHTLNNVLKWYDLKPSQRVKSLDYVRRTHANVAKKEIMTQYDMVITQWAFIG